MSLNSTFPPILDINPSSPAASVYSPLDITADINPPFFQLLAIALCAGVSASPPADIPVNHTPLFSLF
jgi:hypothetical protein